MYNLRKKLHPFTISNTHVGVDDNVRIREPLSLNLRTKTNQHNLTRISSFIFQVITTNNCGVQLQIASSRPLTTTATHSRARMFIKSFSDSGQLNSCSIQGGEAGRREWQCGGGGGYGQARRQEQRRTVLKCPCPNLRSTTTAPTRLTATLFTIYPTT